jgi:hypothetical protein
VALQPRVEQPLAPQPVIGLPTGRALAIGVRVAIEAANGPTIARIAPAHGKIDRTHGQTRRKNGPTTVKTEGRTFAMNSKTTIPALTSGRTIRMQPSGA